MPAVTGQFSDFNPAATKQQAVARTSGGQFAATVEEAIRSPGAAATALSG